VIANISNHPGVDAASELLQCHNLRLSADDRDQLHPMQLLVAQRVLSCAPASDRIGEHLIGCERVD
jgi:hypothetical protein